MKLLLLICWIAGLSALVGCGTSEKAAEVNHGKFYAVSTESAAFYRYGPQQANGPDHKLAHDTLVQMIRPSFGYCKVQLIGGEQGYVANEDIRLASPELVAAATAPPPSEVASHAPKLRFDSSDPRLIAPPEPLPVDLPEPTPIPETEASPTPLTSAVIVP